MKNTLFILAILSLVCACSDDDIESGKPEYHPMQIGNYWVYQDMLIAENGMEDVASVVDSVVITGDSTINGNVYFIFEGTNLINPTWSILGLRRDSLDYVVNENGIIFFSSQNLANTLHNSTRTAGGDKWITINFKMTDPLDPISVPAGTFDVLDYQGEVQTNLPTPQIYPRYIHDYYSKGVGLVLSSRFTIGSTNIIETRLLRYHVEN